MERISRMFTASDGIRLRYLEVRAEKHLGIVLLLHGLGGDACAWSRVQELLFEAGYSSVALDLRGQGASDDPYWLEDYSFERQVKDVVELVSNLGLKKVILVGHCFGGMVSMILAGKSPDWLEKLVLVSTTDLAPVRFLKIDTKKRIVSWLKWLVCLLPKGKKILKRNYDLYVGTGDYNLFRIAADIKSVSLRSYLLSFFNVLGFDGSQWLRTIKAPTLVLCGEKDTVFRKEISEVIAKSIQDSKLVILPRANHVVPINEPDKLTSEIVNFLS